MNYSKLFFFGILAMLLTFSSCKKEEISEMIDTAPEVNPTTVVDNPLVYKMGSSETTTDGLDLGCFSVDFPFDLIADGTTYTINSEEEFDAVFTDEVEYVDFAYPINITYHVDGTTDSIADGEALGEAFASCIPDDGWGDNAFPAFLITDISSCYEIVYPINLVDSDDDVFIINDEDEFIDLISTHENLLFFEFPLSLIDDEGNIAVANDDIELFDLLLACDDINDPNGGTPPSGDCWDFTYPFSMTDQDGNVYEINSHDDLCSSVLYGLELEYVYPLTLVNQDGEVLVVNNVEELEAAWADCFVDFDYITVIDLIFWSNSDGLGLGCYDINFPLEYTDYHTGEAGSIADVAAANEYYWNNDGTVLHVLDFPVTVTEISTGNQISFEDYESFTYYVLNCE